MESYFPEQEFSFGHIDEYSKPEDLQNHPEGHVLLLSSKTRLLYGSPECLEVIDKLCPDRKDRGAYGSIFLGGCKNSIKEKLNILIVNDITGENGGFIKDEDAFKLVGDCYGQISTQLYDRLTQTEQQQNKDYHVIQHRFGWTETDGSDTQYRFGKGTFRPYKLDKVEYLDPKIKSKIDLIIPISSFKGTDKDNPNGASKPQIKPGLYQQKIWLGEKSLSERGQTAISQLLASFPQGIKDFAEELEAQAQKLAENQDDPRIVAQLYCEKYEKRKAFTESHKASLSKEITLAAGDGSLAKQLELVTSNHADGEYEITDENNESPKDDLLMYKLIKADLVGGHNQLLETEKIKQELSKFVQSEWRDIALGRTLTFDRGMIIPSKELKNGEICVTWMDDGEKVLNFRSPFLNSNGLCVSTNKLVDDRLAPDGGNLKGIIVVNDEDHKRILARVKSNEVAPMETESERQARDFDGDCIGVALASKYPNFTAEAEYRNQPQNAYAPTVKLKKQSFYLENGTQPDFEQIAIHMSDSISVGVINNQVTALEALESEIEVLKTYGTLEQQSTYLDQVSSHYQSLFEQEYDEKPKPIRAEYKPFMQSVVALAENPNRRREIIQQAMDVNRLMYREMIGEGCYQNQIAVDLFKSAKKPEMDKIRENSRYLYRDVNYIKDKKSSSVYLSTGITPKGYSPVELLISQTNKYFQESQLESRPIVQFKDLFKGVEFTPQQKFAAVAAKYEFDLKFNAAVRASRRRETESGPSAIVQTDSGTQLSITNLTRYGHPLIWKAQTLNIRLDEIKFTNSERPHKLLAVAQIDGEVGEDGKPAYRHLGTVSQQSVTDHNLKSRMTMQGAKLLELKPELTRSQTKLLFDKAQETALAFYASIPESEKLALSAAAWNICASRQDELEVARKENTDIAAITKKVSNFAFAAFPQEIISRLDKLQFTEPKLVTLKNEANQFLGRDWNKHDLHPIEIRASHHPVGHERHVSRLMFVCDADGEYKEFAMLSSRSGMLPIGTKAQASMEGIEPATANATIGLPGFEPVEITIRELKNFSGAGLVFNAEPVNLEFGTVPMTDKTVKIKIDALTLGELDSDSAQQLKEIDYLKNGNPLKLKLTSISETGDQAFVLGESGNGHLLKINKINFYDFSGQTFHDQDYRKLTIETSASKTRDAVFLNGEPLGVLHFKKDKDALRQLGLLKTGKLTSADAIIESNFSVICAQIDPNTVEYPQKWTKEFQVFDTQSVNSEQQEMIESSAKILHYIKERPTFLFSTESNKKLGVMGLAVDNQKAETVTKWLTAQKVEWQQVPIEDVIRETKKGLAVFNLVSSSIPPKTLSSMTKKFGAVIESDSNYQQRVNSLATRPQFLKPPEQTAQSPPNQSITPLLSTNPSTPDISNSVKTEPLGVEKPPTVRRSRGAGSREQGGGLDGARKPTNPERLRKTGLDTHVPLRFTASGQGLLPPLPAPCPSASSVTIDDLRNWYNAADKLGKSENYKKRIVEVANGFKAGKQLSAQALTVMNQDTFELEAISRLTQIAQRIGMVWGKSDGNGTQFIGKIYDLAFNTQQRDLTISQKNGEVILNLQSGRVQTNKLTPQILQTFEDANTQIDKILMKNKSQELEIHG
ncbi:Ribonuclease HI (plasmid) [Nostoc flagelliforme CCNUN1]|uniref:Ribonuclease HI n=1 Tax=Nostoc flagelliforme CCNUN1 TaxID=2038116 RepID=A0A2K8T6Q6_9NOSO|nr:Ribonuclease HI [Nostoc flagelliforme CCNUN1]